MPLALDSSCSLVRSYWGFLPFVVSNVPHSLKPFTQLPWYLAEHLIIYFHKTLESDYLWDLYYLVKHSKNWLVNQTNPGTTDKRGKKEPQMDKQVIQAWPLMPYFLVNEIKSSREDFTPTFTLYIATFQSKARWCLGKSSKSFQQESSPKPFCPCAHLKVSLEMSALFQEVWWVPVTWTTVLNDVPAEL